MTCRDCQERLFAARCSGVPSEETEVHLLRCPACRDFATALAEVAPGLREWDAPPDRSSATRRAALVVRLAAPPRARVTPLDRPLVPALLGAAGTALGAVIMPDWARGLLFAWLAGAGLVALLVLLQTPWRGAPRGEFDRWTPTISD